MKIINKRKSIHLTLESWILYLLFYLSKYYGSMVKFSLGYIENAILKCLDKANSEESGYFMEALSHVSVLHLS